MSSSRRLAASATAAIVALALALRAARIRNGLPEFIDEAAPFRWAMDMASDPAGRIDWNPHHFIYPSLTIYLHLALQRAHALIGSWTGAFRTPADYLLAYQLDPSPMVILGRALGLVADAVSVWFTCRIGERVRPGVGLLAGLLVALSPILVATSSAIFTDPIMLACSLAALDRMQVHGAGDRWPSALGMAVFAGLAVGSKYTAIVLVVPLAWTLFRAHGARTGLARLAGALAVAALVFLATTPYALLDRVSFLRDVGFDRVLASEGLLGATAGPGGWHTLGVLARDLGPVAAALALVGLVLVLARPREAPGAFPIALTGLVFLAPVLASPLRFERYLLGAIPPAGLLAATALSWAGSRMPSRWRAQALVALVLAATLPVAARAWFGTHTAPSTTAAGARAWLAAHVSKDQLLLMEPYGPDIPSRRDAPAAAEAPLLAQASPALRARFLARPWWSAVRLPALVAGTIVARVQPRSGPAVDVPVFEHASDFNRVVYDARLLAGVDYVLTTDAVRGRLEADPTRYAVPCAFYRLLDSSATLAAKFSSGATMSGPEIRIYRLTGDSAVAAQGVLGRWWWAERIPDPFRMQAGAVLAGSALSRELEVAPGIPSPWVRSLEPIYDSQLAKFAEDLAWNLLALDRPAPAARLMDAALAIQPGSQLACFLRMEACRSLGDWPGARAAFERTAAVTRASAIDSSLVAGYTEALEHTGSPERARALRDSLANLRAR